MDETNLCFGAMIWGKSVPLPFHIFSYRPLSNSLNMKANPDQHLAYALVYSPVVQPQELIPLSADPNSMSSLCSCQHLLMGHLGVIYTQASLLL
jgi:hypothetical protein